MFQPRDVADALGIADRDSNGHRDPAEDPAPVDVEPTSDTSGQSDGKPPSAAAALVDLAMKRYRLGVTPEGEAFGVRNGCHVIRQLRGGRGSLRAELSKLYRRMTGKVAAQQALADALLALEGEAQDSDPKPVHLRVAEADGALWIDLGDAAERVVKVHAGRWEVLDHAPVLFRRTAVSAPMPCPEPGGDMAELWELLNVSEADRPLVLGWLVAALGTTDVPHPILNVSGEQGTGKSTASKMLIDLVDPSPAGVRKPPKDMESWVTAASGSWVVGLDNMSGISEWLSDSLCRAVTGEADVRRQLYTDAGLSVFAFRRVLLLNGIDLGGLCGDMAERLLNIQLDPITDEQRGEESEIWSAWSAVKPLLLGALLTEVAGVKAGLPSVRLDRKPRMADFARVLAALDQRHSTDGLARYIDQTKLLAADSLASDPFISRMMTELDDVFKGTAADLLGTVSPPGDRPPKGWPGSARAVTGLLRRNAPALRKLGWTVEDLGSGNKAKTTHWRIRPREVGKTDPRDPPNPPTGQSGGLAGKAGQKSGPTQDDMAGCDNRPATCPNTNCHTFSQCASAT